MALVGFSSASARNAAPRPGITKRAAGAIGRAVPRSEVERLANDPLPVAQRSSRIAALDREVEELHRIEESRLLERKR